ncbi:hypothetical protein, partial [Bradyrhizobium sp. 76]|uniref:hypothetical protein n=1 Tax=Bradyrhizobium sp. 76 TaxID=2782680 RepID=UPI001FFB05D5
ARNYIQLYRAAPKTTGGKMKILHSKVFQQTARADGPGQSHCLTCARIINRPSRRVHGGGPKGEYSQRHILQSLSVIPRQQIEHGSLIQTSSTAVSLV